MTESAAEGRTLPQAVDVENALLSALIGYGELFQKIEGRLRQEDFYNESNRVIFKAIQALYDRREPIDSITTTEELRRSGEVEAAGGDLRIYELPFKAGTALRVEGHANIIKQKSIARKIIQSTAEIQARAFDDTEDVSDVIEAYEKAVTEINANAVDCESIDMPTALRMATDKASQIQRDREAGKRTAVPTGLSALDTEFAGGWRGPDLIVVGARASMGKTQHALSFAKAASRSGVDVLFVTIEMVSTQLINRYLLEDERISSHNLRTGQMSQEEWNAIDRQVGAMWDMKLHIADSPNIRRLANIKSEARRLHRKGEIKLLIIDYLQLITTGSAFQSRHLEIGYITKELKNLAKELNIPIILLSQLSRPQKGDKGSEPVLNDLKESGEIENDADIVLFIHKPDYYDPQAVDKAGTPWNGRGKLIIAKYREGARNQFILFHHDRRYKKIYDVPAGVISNQGNNEGMPF
jgi:replicative DNA helicase